MRVTKRDTYKLKCDIKTMTEKDLRDVKFSMLFRWYQHTVKGHTDAAKRAKALADEIRSELASRAQERHLAES